MNLQLLKKSNPLLFAPERYDEYPLDPIELSQFLNNSLQQDENGGGLLRDRPFTSVDQLDYLFYVDPKTQELDLEKKMAVEYALFQLQLLKRDNQNNNNDESLDNNISSFEDLLGDNLQSADGLKDLLLTLNSVNGLDLDLNKLNLIEKKSSSGLGNNNNNTNNTRNGSILSLNNISDKRVSNSEKSKLSCLSTDLKHVSNDNISEIVSPTSYNHNSDSIQEITSYLLSSTISHGIELKPKGEMNDSMEFLKNCMVSLIDMAVDKRQQGNGKNIVTDQNKDDNTTASDKDNVNDKRYKELESKLAEMNTAFKDLQLAHNFLTKQYENDHNDSLKDIEKLTRTNKELQEKLLSYHSNLAKRENKDIESDKKEFDGNSVFHSPTKNFSSPALGHTESWTPQTPISSGDRPNSNYSNQLNSPSLSMMKSEFKRLLTETQRKYEKEITQERQMRKQLQNELNLVNTLQ